MTLKNFLGNFFLIALFVLVGFGVYYQSLFVYFLSDDFIWLFEASRSTLATLPQYFYVADGFFYRPTTKLYFYALYQIFELNAFWYHFFNIVIHGLNAFLVFLFVKRILGVSNLSSQLQQYISFFSALFFLVHPIHLEPVVWVSAVTELIPAFFMLLVLNIYSRLSQSQFSIWNMVLICVFYFFAMGGHEFAIVLPLLLVVVDVYLFKNQLFAKRKVYILMLMTALLYLTLRYIAQSHWQGGDYSYNLAKLPFNVAGNLIGYLFFTFFGSSIYDWYEQARVFLRGNLLLAGGISSLVIFLLFLFRKGIWEIFCRLERFYLLMVAFFVIGLLPFLGLGTIAERYVYFSSFTLYVILCHVVYLFCVKVFRVEKVQVEFLGVLFFLSLLFSGLSYAGMEDWSIASAKVNALINGTCTNVEEGDIVVLENSINRVGRAWVFQVGYEQAISLVCSKEVKSYLE
jgi:protein O-mannosyl-transferase